MESEEWKEVKNEGEEWKEQRPWVTGRTLSLLQPPVLWTLCLSLRTPWSLYLLKDGKPGAKHQTLVHTKGKSAVSNSFKTHVSRICCEQSAGSWVGRQELVSARLHLSCVSSQPSAKVKLTGKATLK